MLTKYKIDEIIHARMLALQTEIEKEVQGLNIQKEHKNILFHLLDYSQNRSK